MKFFQSKYFADTTVNPIDKAPTQQEKIINFIATMAEHNDLGGYGLVKVILTTFMVSGPHLRGYYLDPKFIEKNWEVVEDIYANDLYSRKTSQLIDINEIDEQKRHVYFDSESECFVFLAQMSEGETLEIAALKVPHTVDPMTALKKVLSTDAAYYKEVEEIPFKRPPTIGMLTASPMTGLDISVVGLNPIEISEEIYPSGFMDVAQRILDITSDDTKTGITILNGNPGTGKTSFIKWLSSKTTRRLVYVPQDMISEITKPAFLRFLMGNRGCGFILEDAEATLVSRDKGDSSTRSSVISNILNLTDGLLGDVLNCQFICTFNTELENIDPALLRPGRLLMQHEFKPLSTEESNNYLQSVDSEQRVDKPTTIATLMHMDK